MVMPDTSGFGKANMNEMPKDITGRGDGKPAFDNEEDSDDTPSTE